MGGDRRAGEKGGGGKGGGKAARRAQPHDGTFPMKRHAFKVLCPEPLVSSVMGPAGKTKEQIQEETGCKLIVSNRDEYFPGTRFRILIILADEPDGVLPALEKVVDKLVECAEHERGQPARNTDPEFLGKEPGEFIFRATIGTRTSGAVIGPKGANVQAIREENGAKVFIDKQVYQGHQMMKVIAGEEGLRSALVRINECVQSESSADWFPAWAAVRAFEGGPAEEIRGNGRDPESLAERGEHRRGRRDRGGRDRGRRSRSRGGGRRDRSRSHRRGPRDDEAGFDGDGGFDGGDGPGDGEYYDEHGQAVGGDEAMVQAGWSGAEALAQTACEFPARTIEQEYAITCDLPAEKVSALIGKNGSHIQMARRQTGTQIHFEEVKGQQVGDARQQTMMIQGSLLPVYRAHALMMKKYHETEIEAQQRPPPQAQVSAAQVQSVQALQLQLEDLQKQLIQVQGEIRPQKGGKGGKGKGKGKGKSRN